MLNKFLMIPWWQTLCANNQAQGLGCILGSLPSTVLESVKMLFSKSTTWCLSIGLGLSGIVILPKDDYKLTANIGNQTLSAESQTPAFNSNAVNRLDSLLYLLPP